MVFLSGGLFLLNVQATPLECTPTTKSPCIVNDTNSSMCSVHIVTPQNDLVNFRSGDSLGLALSGSAQPREKSWLTLSELIPRRFKQRIDLDLRQESHGYLNGDATTLYTTRDRINQGNAIMTRQNQMLSRSSNELFKQSTPTYKARYQRLKAFYAYAKARRLNPNIGSWSHFVAKKPT